MDVDPLADTVPPRYAVESDDEDEFNPLPTTVSYLDHVTEVKLIPDNLLQGNNLVIATGEVAKYWAHGANLGVQIGGGYVNNVQVGLVFNPSWTKSIIIVSEAFTRLPVWAMHQYASTILHALMPAKVALLDTYSAPAYISEKPVPFEDAPLRYLATYPVDHATKSKAEPFAPPNILQSTSASFLSVLSTTRSQTPGALILVPSPHIDPSSPKILEPSNFFQSDKEPFDWSEVTINMAQDLVFGAINSTAPHWVRHTGSGGGTSSARKKNDVREGGMYI
ncbi:hypothetical protein J132_03351 [Termitomyces sp. J132]|nr:hypothetical protein H2248_003308 [Termitomyces sp. 'cryptogamus']KNZ77842.1 hypothetical protein J132_03351 [Termitomyces sp. J132]